MDDYANAQTCMAKVGLLFLRDCGSMMKNTCTACGRPVCREHSIESEPGVLCPECSASRQDQTENPAVANAARRSGYYDDYGYSPFYYGHTSYFSDHDYRTFDGEPVTPAVSEEDWNDRSSSGGWDSDHDPLES